MIACKTLGPEGASMIIGGDVSGAIGTVTGVKIKQSDKEDDTQSYDHTLYLH